MRQGLPRYGNGPQEPVSDDRFDDRASPPASGHGPQKRGADKALGRSRGGLTTKVHLLANDLGLPVDLLVTGGTGPELPPRPSSCSENGRPSGCWPTRATTARPSSTIPRPWEPSPWCPKSNRKQQRTDDKDLCQQRNRIERCFSRLKHFRRFATRYEKLKQNFNALVALACIHLLLYADTA